MVKFIKITYLPTHLFIKMEDNSLRKIYYKNNFKKDHYYTQSKNSEPLTNTNCSDCYFGPTYSFTAGCNSYYCFFPKTIFLDCCLNKFKVKDK